MILIFTKCATFYFKFFSQFYLISLFFANRTLALKETMNSIEHPKKNKNYNEILEKPFIFNLQTVSTARRRCRSSLSRPDVVGCGPEIVEWVKKTTSILKTKKKEELSMKLLDDPKIPSQMKSLKTTPLPQASRRCHQDGVEAKETLLYEAPPPPPKCRPYKP
jgi:hypothetical protein